MAKRVVEEDGVASPGGYFCTGCRRGTANAALLLGWRTTESTRRNSEREEP